MPTTADACCCGLRCCPQICSEQHPSGDNVCRSPSFTSAGLRQPAPQPSSALALRPSASVLAQAGIYLSFALCNCVGSGFRDIDEYDLARKGFAPGFASLSRFQSSDACIAHPSPSSTSMQPTEKLSDVLDPCWAASPGIPTACAAYRRPRPMSKLPLPPGSASTDGTAPAGGRVCTVRSGADGAAPPSSPPSAGGAASSNAPASSASRAAAPSRACKEPYLLSKPVVASYKFGVDKRAGGRPSKAAPVPPGRPAAPAEVRLTPVQLLSGLLVSTTRPMVSNARRRRRPGLQCGGAQPRVREPLMAIHPMTTSIATYVRYMIWPLPISRRTCHAIPGHDPMYALFTHFSLHRASPAGCVPLWRARGTARRDRLPLDALSTPCRRHVHILVTVHSRDVRCDRLSLASTAVCCTGCCEIESGLQVAGAAVRLLQRQENSRHPTFRSACRQVILL